MPQLHTSMLQTCKACSLRICLRHLSCRAPGIHERDIVTPSHFGTCTLNQKVRKLLSKSSALPWGLYPTCCPGWSAYSNAALTIHMPLNKERHGNYQQQVFLTQTTNTCEIQGPSKTQQEWATEYQPSYLHMLAGIAMFVWVTLYSSNLIFALASHFSSRRLWPSTRRTCTLHRKRKNPMRDIHIITDKKCKFYVGPASCAKEFHNPGTVYCFQVFLGYILPTCSISSATEPWRSYV